MSGRLRRWLLVLVPISILFAGVVTQAASETQELIPNYSFRMVRSSAAEARACVPNANGLVTVETLDGVQKMVVTIEGLPANTDFDLFLTQLPNAPYGLAWYEGEIRTDDAGRGSQTFMGRYGFETFAVAFGSGGAPLAHPNGRYPDDTTNPTFNPIHTYHLGVWFGSPLDARAAGCSRVRLPFDGDHRSGIQVLSTRQFRDINGPLRRIGTTR